MSWSPPSGEHPLAKTQQMLDDNIVYIVSDSLPTTLAGREPNGDFKPMEMKEARLVYGTLQYLDNKGVPRSALDFWLKTKTSGKRYLRQVFKKPGTEAPDEYNLFSGFAVDTTSSEAQGLLKARPFLRHCYRMICNGNRKQFRYFIRYLAWMVQHIGENPEVALILISEAEGAGKSLIGRVFEHVLGQKHCGTIGSPLALYDNKNAFTRRWILVMADDIKDMKKSEAPKLRGAITAHLRRVEEKFIPVTYVPNCLSLIITSNSETPIPLGIGSRRYVVLRVSEVRIGDFPYFKRIENSIANGGAAQLLRFLLGVRLRDFHPRQIPGMSEEIMAGQLEAANSVVRWLVASHDFGDQLLTSSDTGIIQSGMRFGGDHFFKDIYAAYTSWAKTMGERPILSTKAAGTTLKKLFGPSSYRKNMPSTSSNQDQSGRGYATPDVDEFEMRLEAWLDNSKRHDLEKRCHALRAIKQKVRSPAKDKTGRLYANHRASPYAAALMAAWPAKRTKGMSYAEMVKLAQSSTKGKSMKIALDDISTACRDVYDRTLNEADMEKVIRAFAGACQDDNVFAVDQLSGDLALIRLPNITIEDQRNIPIGVQPRRDGTLWDVVTDDAFVEETEEG